MAPCPSITTYYRPSMHTTRIFSEDLVQVANAKENYEEMDASGLGMDLGVMNFSGRKMCELVKCFNCP
jgi:hypothetical protein